MPEPEAATALLAQLSAGDASAAERLMRLVYHDLHAMSARVFRDQPADHTLQPTALVHEAFLKLVHGASLGFQDRTHFFAVAATAMRQILADHARRVRSAKRGGDRDRVALDGVALGADAASDPVDLVALDDALQKLALCDQRQCRVVELKFFGGLSMEEVAANLGVSKATVELDWRAARAWLHAELSRT